MQLLLPQLLVQLQLLDGLALAGISGRFLVVALVLLHLELQLILPLLALELVLLKRPHRRIIRAERRHRERQ